MLINIRTNPFDRDIINIGFARNEIILSALNAIQSSFNSAARLAGRSISFLKSTLSFAFYSMIYGSSTSNSLNILFQANLLTPENREKVLNYKLPEELDSALTILQKFEMLTEENLIDVINHGSCKGLALAISALKQANIMTPQNRNSVLLHRNIGYLGDKLALLSLRGILTQDNLTHVLNDNNSGEHRATYIIIGLYEAGIMTPSNTTRVLMHRNPQGAMEALCLLHRAGILNNDEPKNQILNHSNPYYLATCIVYFHETGIQLTPENIVKMSITSGESWEILWALKLLQKAEMLTSDNANKMLNHEYPQGFYEAFRCLEHRKKFTSENIAKVLAHKDSYVEALKIAYFND